jgi:hypothetical protein
MADCKIIARGTLGDHQIEAPVVNPGGWFGQTWLIEIGMGYWSSYFCVEADTLSDAIDEFSDSQYGHLIHINESDLADYGIDTDEPTCYFAGNDGKPSDLTNMAIHGVEGRRGRKPWNCSYFATEGKRWPRSGVDPLRVDVVVALTEEKS